MRGNKSFIASWFILLFFVSFSLLLHWLALSAINTWWTALMEIDEEIIGVFFKKVFLLLSSPVKINFKDCKFTSFIRKMENFPAKFLHEKLLMQSNYGIWVNFLFFPVTISIKIDCLHFVFFCFQKMFCWELLTSEKRLFQMEGCLCWKDWNGMNKKLENWCLCLQLSWNGLDQLIRFWLQLKKKKMKVWNRNLKILFWTYKFWIILRHFMSKFSCFSLNKRFKRFQNMWKCVIFTILNYFTKYLKLDTFLTTLKIKKS